MFKEMLSPIVGTRVRGAPLREVTWVTALLGMVASSG